MELIIDWGGFIGAWLLAMGPIYQAALELSEQDIEIDRIRAAGRGIEKLPPVSVWWWLFPPAKLFLENRRSNNYRRTLLAAMVPDDVKALMDFMSKASGWMFVASGAFLLACKETFELLGHYGFNLAVFIVIVVGMTMLSLGNTVYRMKRARAVIERTGRTAK